MQAEAACEALRRAAMTRESSSSRLRVRYRTADVGSGLVARRRGVERHLGRRQRLQTARQPFKLGMADPGAGAARVNKPPIGIVIGEQQGPRKDRVPSGRSRHWISGTMVYAIAEW